MKPIDNNDKPVPKYYGYGYGQNYYEYEDREIYGRRATYSSFWMPRSKYSHATVDAEKVLKLAAIKRAITNFVRIMTRRNDIIVKYSTTDESKTNGKTVILSGAADSNLDASVGLALHESAHIMKSDFDIRRNTTKLIPNELYKKYARKFKLPESVAEQVVSQIIATLHNVIEDRWIDNYIYTTCPGYKGYMREMYNMYFNSAIISLALKSKSYRTEDWKSYEFRIINIVNQDTDLKALKGLKQIWNLLDLKNISRINSTRETFDLACEVFAIILKFIKPEQQSQPQQSNNKNDQEETESNSNSDNDDSEENGNNNTNKDNDEEDNEENGSNNNEENDDEENEDDSEENEDDSDGEDDSEENGNSQNNKNVPTEELTNVEISKLTAAIDKQKEFLNDELRKETISDKETSQVQSMEESGTELIEVGDSIVGKVNVLVIRNLTKNIIDNGLIGILTYHTLNTTDMQHHIDKGIILGKLLGKKIALRNDEKETKNTRLHSGRIDKRLLASIGYGNEAVFHTTFIDKFENVNLHISIDASGSMTGEKFKNTMTSIVAIAQAASMVKNINVKIDFRFTSLIGKKDTPCLLIAYDSRVDTMNKIQTLFKHIEAAGYTPEGLCFQSIFDIITSDSKGKQSYFINFSDGHPEFSKEGIHYSGCQAQEHTKVQVDKIKSAGIKVLSYFIANGYYGNLNSHPSLPGFQKMYGKDARIIDVTAIIPLAKTLNDKFLEK